MSISKKIRFEIFKRDGFKCAYCGKAPPIVTLELDHIEPKAKGGKDDINNYLTACFDCNRGKRDIPLEKIPGRLQENLEILREKEAQLREYRIYIKKIDSRVNKDIEEIDCVYSEAFPGWSFSNQFKQVTLKKFLSLLPKHIIIDSLRYSIARINNKDQVIKYFCGVCWGKIKGVSNDKLIIREWEKLSSHYGKGSGYYRKQDALGIAHLWGDWMIGLMHETFNERRQSYWAHFMNLVSGGNYESS